MSYFGARGRMTQMVLEKVKNDEYLNSIDRTQWYKLHDTDQFSFFYTDVNSTASLLSKFVESHEDMDTSHFIAQSFEKSEWFVTQLVHSLIMTVLRFFMTNTTMNGLLNRGSMFVFSMEQFKTLIQFNDSMTQMDYLLDLGAGDGAVTSKMAPFFKHIYATEMSCTMQWHLERKGYKVLDVDSWDKVPVQRSLNSDDSISQMEEGHQQYLKYDAISVLNLLDRCDRPITLLKKIKAALKPNGLLIVALVLPFKPFVEYNKSNEPSEQLFASNTDYYKAWQRLANFFYTEQTSCKGNKINKVNLQIVEFVEHIMRPLGFELTRFTRLPYLCEGNLSQSYFYLHDYVFIFMKSD